jgi:hypothetical protein
MRVFILGAILCALISSGAADPCAAQSAEPVRIATATPVAGPTPKFKFILFWKEDNAATRGMADGLQKAIAQRADRAEWTSVNVKDAAQRAIVERYRVERAPMPIVLCIAPNGAITGGITRQISDAAVDGALVTPGMAEAAKAIQEKRIVVIQVKRDAATPLPAGAATFMAEPDFAARTTAIGIVLDDPAESRFLAEMKIKPEEVVDSQLVILAPPGALVGKFPAGVTRDQIVGALHAAGKCCNDPNCKHNQKKGQ